MRVIFYRDKFGFSEFEEWLTTIDAGTRARILTRLLRIEAGNLGDHKYLEQGIFEIRFFFGPGYRIYFAKANDCIVVLLLGGDKKSQSRDIKKATSLYKEYLRSENEI